jgi:RNA polymerase sigma-70 factor (ECF subfamily)
MFDVSSEASSRRAERSSAVREEAERSCADIAMDRYADGDDAAFAAVYDALAERLFSYLRRKLMSVARAEDLVQQTFLQMHRARGSFVAGSAVLPWAFAIARRLMIDDLRCGQRNLLANARELAEEVAQPSLDAAADDLLDAGELARKVQRRLELLPIAQRNAFELVRFEGLSHAEAGEVLGMTASSVKLRVHRAYIALRGALAARRA